MTEINTQELLAPLRKEIDEIDRQLVDLLARRFEVVHKVGQLKAEHDISPVQRGRMEEVLDRVADMAQVRDLDPALVRNLYEVMIDHAHSLEFGYKDNE